MNIRNTAFHLIMGLGAFASARGQSAPTPTPAHGILDFYRPKESHVTIQQAAATGDVNTLVLALEKGVDVDYIIDLISNLPRAEGAQLAARALTDETFLHPADVGWEAAETGMHQLELHRVLEHKAYALLGEKPPEFHGRLNRAELRVLADRLQSVK